MGALVIVESPAKSKTIQKYLGYGYKVSSSIGHIRDLPQAGGKTTTQTGVKENPLFRRMGINPEKNWEARYEIMPGKQKVVKELRELAAKADVVYLATDLDREGEAIAWHLQQVIGGDPSRFKRVTFNEITKKAITEAFARPTSLNMHMVEAQQARRFLDRVVGFSVSPLLWQKVARGLSAGRVQSVATRLVVDREKEIRAFVPEEYWQVLVDVKSKPNGRAFVLAAVKDQGQKLELKNEAEARAIVQRITGSDLVVQQVKGAMVTARAPAPFITSTLQQTASTRLGFGVKKTMTMAQKLYEGGYITYMRTDSTFLSQDALNMVRGYIDREFSKEYLPLKPNFYGNKANAQEAHEAIRPSDVNTLGRDLGHLDKDAARLYDLIWQQFVACQMTPAVYQNNTMVVEGGGVELHAKGRTVVFDGYTKVRPVSKKDDEQELPEVNVGQSLLLVKDNGMGIRPIQHFTKPPARYNEAALVKEMEKRGIGRPSTYATIISTIVDRGYVKIVDKRMHAEKIGEVVTQRLCESFENLMDYDFTAGLEKKLDDIAEGRVSWLDVLNPFYQDLSGRIKHASGKDGMRDSHGIAVDDVLCPKCQRGMVLKTGSTGVFLGCSGYALPEKEGRCKTTISLVRPTKQEEDHHEKHRCPKCNSTMDEYYMSKDKMLLVCGNQPDCDGHLVQTGSFPYVAAGSDAPTYPCDYCGADMHLNSGRFGNYYKCVGCSYVRACGKDGQIGPPKIKPIAMPHLKTQDGKDHLVLREGSRGMFLAAASYPKVRETRPVLVKEVLDVIDQLPERLKFLKDFATQVPSPSGGLEDAVVSFDGKTYHTKAVSERTFVKKK